MSNNSTQEWSPRELAELKNLSETSTPTRLIAIKLGKTIEAVQTKARSEGLILKEVDLALSQRSRPAAENEQYG